jgi:hypothetical protein
VSGWNEAKVRAYEEAYEAFSSNVYIASKETGARTCLASNRYEAQKWFLRGIWGGLADDIHDFKILKSRQLGCSTEARALIAFWMGMHPGIRGAMIFDTDAHKEEARLEVEAIIRDLPKAVKFPKIRSLNRYMMTLEAPGGGPGSVMRFMAAGVRTSKTSGVLGRSSGINLVHASEMCSWDNPEGLRALKQSLAENYEDRAYFWESTGRGYNDWHEMWEEAKLDDLNQKAIFLGWWLKDSQRINRGTEAWERYGSDPPNREELSRIAKVKELYGYEVSLEQLAWYRRKMDPTRDREEDEPEDTLLLQEQPWTESECFQTTGSTFFKPEILTDRMHTAQETKYQAYTFWPGLDFFTSTIQPARTWREVRIKLWEEPVPQGAYVVAVDPAFGHDEDNDRSTIEVLRCYADELEQVCEYTSASTPTHELAWLTLSLGAYYGLYSGSTVTNIIELNGPGDGVWRELGLLTNAIRTGYYASAARDRGIADTINNIRQYVYTRSDAMHPGHNYHWVTDSRRKVSIMERLRDFVHTGKILVRSREALEEMRSVTRDGDTIKAEGRKHDDRVVALALGIRAWEERLQRTLMSQNRTKAADTAKRALSMSDQYRLFNQYHLDSLLKVKERSRLMAQHSGRRTGVRHNWSRR